MRLLSSSSSLGLIHRGSLPRSEFLTLFAASYFYYVSYLGYSCEWKESYCVDAEMVLLRTLL